MSLACKVVLRCDFAISGLASLSTPSRGADHERLLDSAIFPVSTRVRSPLKYCYLPRQRRIEASQYSRIARRPPAHKGQRSGKTPSLSLLQQGEFQCLSGPHNQAAFFSDISSRQGPPLSTPGHAITSGFAVCLSSGKNNERMAVSDTATKRSTGSAASSSIRHVLFSALRWVNPLSPPIEDGARESPRNGRANDQATNLIGSLGNIHDGERGRDRNRATRVTRVVS
jgi:hypothetical protein